MACHRHGQQNWRATSPRMDTPLFPYSVLTLQAHYEVSPVISHCGIEIAEAVLYRERTASVLILALILEFGPKS